ncbi:CcmD family protein [Taibaiella koreensis]|uniref:CcmD family protein n=1 Tax=Taibaiella koreensis TaxID=1268548 RepID=UPI000E59B0A6|nr:CcmD family protein [Taibaiella koreensis]
MKIFRNISTWINSKRLLTLLLLLPLFCQAHERPEMADTFRSSGKIYVVLLVICTIFAGIILFLVFLERKIKKLERNQHNHKQ